MEHPKVIRPRCLPTGLPLKWSLIIYLLLDKFQASNLIKGVVWTLVAVVWLISIIALILEDYIDLDLGKLPKK